MAAAIATIDTLHEDMIHDTQFDYYAKKLATCSSDRTIKIFEVVGEKYVLSATLTGHEGPVWQVSWAHPKYGVLLASCSYDGYAFIYRESPQNNWAKVYEHKFNDCSVNSISWSPHEYGLILACATSDGRVCLLEHQSNTWQFKYFQNDSLGCNSVSWAPHNAIGSVMDGNVPVRRLVTGSCDNMVRIWKSVGLEGQWVEEPRQQIGMAFHSDWVRDVAWAPNTAMSCNIIASCSEDRTVIIWKQSAAAATALNNNTTAKSWNSMFMKVFDAPVWRVSWSVTGNVLAVSTGDHKVSLWKQAVDESWVEISAFDSTSNNSTTTNQYQPPVLNQ